MKGVVFLGDKECEVREFPDPVPNDGEVRVKMMASGICGSDLHLYRGDSAWAKERGDRIPGHEPCGVVDAYWDRCSKGQGGRPRHRVPLSGLRILCAVRIGQPDVVRGGQRLRRPRRRFPRRLHNCR